MDENNITLTGTDGNTIVINLNDTYGATTTYSSDAGFIATDVSAISPYTISIDDSVDLSTISITDINSSIFNWHEDTRIDVNEVEKMCKEYPALAKVYENFKTVYDLVKQDWKGKKDAENNS